MVGQRQAVNFDLLSTIHLNGCHVQTLKTNILGNHSSI